MLTYQNENIGKSFAFRSREHRQGYSVPPHIHEYSEIMYVTDGEMTMYLDGKKLIVSKGQMVFVFPNQAHEYTSETPCNIWCAVFSNDFLHAFYHLYSDKIPKSSVIDVSECSELVFELQKTQENDVIERAGILHLLFSKLAKTVEFDNREGKGSTLYNSAINYISSNFRSDFTLADMAKALGYHEKYLSSELHLLTKMNFRAFIATYRVDHAKRQLRSTARTISDIAFDSGFSSINTFNRVFKQVTGITPSEYRSKKGVKII